MSLTAPGLSRLGTEELRALLRALYRGDLEFPAARHELLTRGLNNLADFGEVLHDLDNAGAKAVLVAVLAERQRPGGLDPRGT